MVAEHDDVELDEMEDDDDLGNEPPEMDFDAPMNEKLGRLVWKDAGSITEDPRGTANAPRNFTPSMRLADKET